MNRKIIKLIKKVLPSKIVEPLREFNRVWIRLNSIEKNQERILNERYSKLLENRGDKDKFRAKEFKIFSQNGEDGLLLHIFSKIGTTNKKFVELGIEEGKECNTANLSINFGWQGLLLEWDRGNVKKAKSHYASNLKDQSKVKIVNCFVTKENINSVIRKNNISGEIDLLSVDIDGNDYWIWEAINVINPRVVVIEYNPIFGTKKSISVKYNSFFKARGNYFGASLKALTKLAKRKGYLLVGCSSIGSNAFFVKKDVIRKRIKKIPILSPEEAYYPGTIGKNHETNEEQFAKIKHLDFVEIK